jgi:hypothetical protein
LLDGLRTAGFDVLARNHAEAILAVDFPDEVAELVAALRGFAIPAAELIGSGGGEARSTQRLRRGLAEAGWRKHRFEIALTVDGRVKEAVTHEIDHVRRGAAGTLALEIEWNNKDPFFDRDLENFQRLHYPSPHARSRFANRAESRANGHRHKPDNSSPSAVANETCRPRWAAR